MNHAGYGGRSPSIQLAYPAYFAEDLGGQLRFWKLIKQQVEGHADEKLKTDINNLLCAHIRKFETDSNLVIEFFKKLRKKLFKSRTTFPTVVRAWEEFFSKDKLFPFIREESWWYLMSSYARSDRGKETMELIKEDDIDVAILMHSLIQVPSLSI